LTFMMKKNIVDMRFVIIVEIKWGQGGAKTGSIKS
jgi:hypothetical protein